MKIPLIRSRLFAAPVVIIGLASLLLSCGGGSSDMVGGSGGMVQVRVSATGADTLLSSIPADALATAGNTTGATVADRSRDPERPRLQSFEITFLSIDARSADGVPVPVTIALPFTVDILGLSGGASIELPIGVLPAGTYRGFDVTISLVSLMLEDGTRITIEPPEGGWTAVIRTRVFAVVDGEPTTVDLRLRLNRALRWLGHGFGFDPVFDCEVHGGQHHDDHDDGHDDDDHHDDHDDGDDGDGDDDADDDGDDRSAR